MATSDFLFIASVQSDSTWSLDSTEANHAFKVLRLATGDEIQVTDGLGRGFFARLGLRSKEGCTLELEAPLPASSQPLSLSMYIAPPKAGDRLEWMIEKSVELGLIDFHFIHSRRSERKKINLERLNAIARSAMKQSRRFYAPRLHPLLTLPEALRQLKNPADAAFATCAAISPIQKVAFNSSFPALFIGPEGDFSPEEIEQFIHYSLQPVHLGTARLRTETAALTAVFTHFSHNALR